MGEMCRWLVANKTVARVTLSGRLELIPFEEAYPPEVREQKNEWYKGSGAISGEI